VQNAAGVRGTFSNVAYTPAELAHQVGNSRASHIFVHPDLVPIVLDTLALLKVPKKDFKKRVIVLTKTGEGPKGFITFADVMKHGKQLKPEDFNGDKVYEVCPSSHLVLGLLINGRVLDLFDVLLFWYNRS